MRKRASLLFVFTFFSFFLSSCGQKQIIDPLSYGISGKALLNGAAFSSVTIKLSGAQTLETTTGADGRFSFQSLPKGLVYTVTPERYTYFFSPRSFVINLTSEVVNANFTAVVGKAISGYARTSGVGEPDVTISLTKEGDASFSTSETSVSDGSYTCFPLNDGIYYLTACKDDRSFTPKTRTAEVSGSSVYDIDFNASYALTGRVIFSKFGLGVKNVTVKAFDNIGVFAGIATTDATGDFMISNLAKGAAYTYTVTKEGWSLSKQSGSITASSADFPYSNLIVATPEGYGVVSIGDINKNINTISINWETGVGACSGNSGTILVTTDSGETWVDRTSNLGVSDTLVYSDANKLTGRKLILAVSEGGTYYLSRPETDPLKYGYEWPPATEKISIGSQTIPYRGTVIYNLEKNLEKLSVIVSVESASTINPDIGYAVDQDTGKYRTNTQFLTDAFVLNSGTWSLSSYNQISEAPFLLTTYASRDAVNLVSIIGGREGFMALSSKAISGADYKTPTFSKIYKPTSTNAFWSSDDNISAIDYRPRNIFFGTENGKLCCAELDSSNNLTGGTVYFSDLPVKILGISAPADATKSSFSQLVLVGENGVMLRKN